MSDVIFRKLVQYCVLKGYLRRVRDFRISLDETTPMNNFNARQNENKTNEIDHESINKAKLKKDLRELCDGTHDSDSLACSGFGKFHSHHSLSIEQKSMHFTFVLNFQFLVFSARPTQTGKKSISQLDSYLTIWK